MTSNPLADIIASKGWCVADGATGTNLFARGLETGYPPELWSVERPDDILWLHNSFLDAGSDLILTNSFGGTSFRLKLHHAQDRVMLVNNPKILPLPLLPNAVSVFAPSRYDDGAFVSRGAHMRHPTLGHETGH